MNDTGKARLPGLVSPRIADADLARWVQAVSERLEVREGTRGNPYERALTVRDLVGTGLVHLGAGGGVVPAPPPGTGTPGIGAGDGNYEKLWDELKNSRLYKELMVRIDDPDRFNDLADEVKAVLLNDIAEEARRRGADVQRLDTKIQTDLRSLAMSVQEVTAAVDDASAGVRSTQFAQAETGRAIAGQVTQVVARLDGDTISPADLVAPVYDTLDKLRTARPTGVVGKYYQVKNPINLAPPILYRWDAARGRYVLAGMANSAAIEQVMKATADKIEGLSAEYFVKVQAGGAFGGFGLSAHEKEGVGYSQFLIAADRFSMVNPSGNLNPFAISQVNGTGPYYIYLNGQVRINANGGKAEDLENALDLSASGQVFNVDNKGAVTPSSLTVTATLKGRLAGKSVTFSSIPANAGSASGNTYLVPSSAFGSGATVKVTATASVDGLTYSDNFTLYKVVDGADALVGFLTNESHGVPASSTGAVSSYAGAGGEMVVFKGGQRLTSGVTYSMLSNPNNLVASISSASGAYVISGGLAGDSATVTFRATVGAATIDKVFTLTRQKSGETGKDGKVGEDGKRGSLTAYSTAACGNWLQGGSWDTYPTMNNHHAALGIWFLLNPNNWSMPAGNGHLRIGDTVTLTSADKTKAETRYWSGSSWVTPGVVIDGNLLVKGTISGDKINADQAFFNHVKAVDIDASKITSGTISADKIGSGVNSNNYGYSFGFGTGGGVLSLSGAGFFRSDSANTYALAAVHTAGNAAILGTATGSGGIAGLFGFGPISTPTYSATLAKDGLGGFFQHRSGAGGPSNDTHDSNSISTAKLATPSYAGTFKCNSLTTVLCGPGGGANQGVYTTGGLYVEEFGVIAKGFRVDGLLAANQGVKVELAGYTTEIGRYNQGAYQGLYTNGGLYVAGWGIIEYGLGVYGSISATDSIYSAGKVLTFTGAHFALLPKAAPAVLGDIVLDASVVARGGISEVITGVTLSSAPNQKGALGVYSGDDSSVPMSMAKKGEPVAFGPDAKPAFDPQYDTLLQTHKVITVNSLGEGQINLCGEGGDLEIGDLIVTSSMPGKGAKQADDLVRATTVAKVREAVKFASPAEVKMAACIYLCG